MSVRSSCPRTISYHNLQCSVGLWRCWVELLDQSSPRFQAVLAKHVVNDGVNFGASLCTHEQARVDVLREGLRVHDAACSGTMMGGFISRVPFIRGRH